MTGGASSRYDRQSAPDAAAQAREGGFSGRVRAGRRMRSSAFGKRACRGQGFLLEIFCRHGRQYVPELTKGQTRCVCPAALSVREAED